eukprot:550994-Pyramimonas_sp.AAC.1
MAQPTGNGFILGRRGRNPWRNRSGTALFSAAKRADQGATGRRRCHVRPHRAQPMAHLIAG